MAAEALDRFTLSELSLDQVGVCADAIRGLGGGTGSMEEAAQRVVEYLRATLVDAEGSPACVLVRLYKTHPFGELEPGLQEFARAVAGRDLAAEVRCLTLLGTDGDRPEWQSRRLSQGHQAIPLADAEMVERLPMVLRLITALGLGVDEVVSPTRETARGLAVSSYGVFHVREAAGSPHLPAQDFVLANAVASAVGFGGVLYTGDFYAVVMFSRVEITEQVASNLKILSLPVRVPLLPFAGRSVFSKA